METRALADVRAVAESVEGVVAPEPMTEVPVIMPGGNPVMDWPVVPMLPVIRDEPEEMMPLTAMTAKGAAVPRVI